MTGPTVGSLCAGYGGLDLAIGELLGGTTIWLSEIDKDCSTLLAKRFPDVPNLGDLTAIDWSTVEPVDILCAGFPCQPFSHAGKRKGEDDERAIFAYVADAIGVLRPGLVVLENVTGLLTLGGPGVVGALAAMGYDARWGVVRASDAGAPHRRARWFCIAAPWDGVQPAPVEPPAGSVETVDRLLPTPRAQNGESRNMRPWQRPLDEPQNLENALARLLPTPTSSEAKNTGENMDWEKRRSHTRSPGTELMRLLPTPVVNDMGEGKTPEEWDKWTDDMRDRHGNGNGHGASLAVEAARLLPTPTTVDSKVFGPNVDWDKRNNDHGASPASVLMDLNADRLLPTPRTSDANGPGEHGDGGPDLRTVVQTLLPTPTARDWKDTGDLVKSCPDDDSRLPRAIAHHVGLTFGPFQAAIDRWEVLMGRPAPAPVDERGIQPELVEWMMGLPEGWVCDLGLSRSAELKMLGNGVVPQQARLALSILLGPAGI